ncbi:ficolin-2-like [Sabethes cyaneus]|uniref:ficolin-2-like n=1 Tax=Sabethes cyaneus TaxID=53552 RepID=UPI00237D73E3|nr:ficolin-2-like [Sabethes cyaneus]XP_053695055.1 ficolin-2-like [Sabethes cyaneus]
MKLAKRKDYLSPIVFSILLTYYRVRGDSCQTSVEDRLETIKNELCLLENEFEKLTTEVQNAAWSIVRAKKSLSQIKYLSNDCTLTSCPAVEPDDEASNNSCTNMNMADLMAQYFKEYPNVEIKFTDISSETGGCNETTTDETPPLDRYEVVKSCREAKQSGNFVLKLDSTDEGFPVLCDAEYEGGGWVVIQHRFNGYVDFYRSWTEYRQGFGEFDSEFWLGNDKIYRLTAAEPREIHFVLTDWENNSALAKYSSFQIGNAAEKYVLKSLGTYSGTAGDSLWRALNSKFSTADQDNDSSNDNCAIIYHGAWWYSSCHMSNLNGKYVKGTNTEYATSMCWESWKGYYYGLKTSKILIRF